MKLYLFVVQEKGCDTPWVDGAWDEWSVEENYDGYKEAVEEHKKKYGSDFRVGIVTVPDNFLTACFKAHVVEGKPE